MLAVPAESRNGSGQVSSPEQKAPHLIQDAEVVQMEHQAITKAIMTEAPACA